MVKAISKHVDVDLEESDISTSHRLPAYVPPTTAANTGTNEPPKKKNVIIAKLTRRDIRDRILSGRSKLYQSSPSGHPNALIFEDVTPQRSRIMYQLKHREGKNFKQVWSQNGKIYARTEEQTKMNPLPKATIINNVSDLMKHGWTQAEVLDIIRGKRD